MYVCAGNVLEIRRVQKVVSRCVADVGTLWKRSSNDASATASTTGVATSSATLASRTYRSAAADKTNSAPLRVYVAASTAIALCHRCSSRRRDQVEFDEQIVALDSTLPPPPPDEFSIHAQDVRMLVHLAFCYLDLDR